MNTKEIFISRNVHFYEFVFPFAHHNNTLIHNDSIPTPPILLNELFTLPDHLNSPDISTHSTNPLPYSNTFLEAPTGHT